MRELEGLTVVEVGDFIPAAYCGWMLAGCGAEVIKIEPPGGDACRRFGPFPGDMPHPEKSGLSLYLNAGKESVVLDLDTPDGRDLLLGLAGTADVVVEDLPAGYLEQRGLGYPRLQDANPKLIVASISPFGRTGPYREYRAYDLQMWHGSAAGHRFFGAPDREPIWGAWYMASHYGAVNAAYAVLAALFARERTGRGQRVDISATDCIAALSTGSAWVALYRQTGEWERRQSNLQGTGAPTGMYRATDGYIYIMALAGHQWDGLVQAMGSPEWALDQAYAGHSNNRAPHAERVYAGVDAWMKQHTVQEVFQACYERGVPAAPVASARDVHENPHLLARRFFVEYEHSVAGTVRVPGGLVRGPGEEFPAPTPAPLLGQHTQEVLSRVTGAASDRRRSAAAVAASTELPRAGAPTAIRPLEGFRAVNFGWYWAGPLAGQALGDMGADLITIETRKRLTAARFSKPFLHNKLGDPDHNLWGHNIYRSARNVTLDIADPDGRDLFKRIIQVSDVLIVNFAARVMDQLGLGYQELRQVNPALVMVYMSAAGLTGPLKGMQLFGSVIGAVAGIDSVQGYPGEEPLSQGASVPDPLNGVFGAFAALAALSRRQRTGEGCLVDLSQWETLASITAGPLMDWWLNRRLGSPMGNRHPHMAPHGVYPSKGEDQWVSIAVATDAEWQGLRQALGAPAWTGDERFRNAEGRLQHQDELDRRIGEWSRGRTDYEATRALQANGVAAFPALSLKEMFDDPHFQARETWVEVEHELGRETITGIPWKLSETPGRVLPNHVLGADNGHVFGDMLGLTAETLASLEKDSVLT